MFDWSVDGVGSSIDLSKQQLVDLLTSEDQSLVILLLLRDF